MGRDHHPRDEAAATSSSEPSSSSPISSLLVSTSNSLAAAEASGQRLLVPLVGLVVAAFSFAAVFLLFSFFRRLTWHRDRQLEIERGLSVASTSASRRSSRQQGQRPTSYGSSSIRKSSVPPGPVVVVSSEPEPEPEPPPPLLYFNQEQDARLPRSTRSSASFVDGDFGGEEGGSDDDGQGLPLFYDASNSNAAIGPFMLSFFPPRPKADNARLPLTTMPVPSSAATVAVVDTRADDDDSDDDTSDHLHPGGTGGITLSPITEEAMSSNGSIPREGNGAWSTWTVSRQTSRETRARGGGGGGPSTPTSSPARSAYTV
jgi:hypothetical protein